MERRHQDGRDQDQLGRVPRGVPRRSPSVAPAPRKGAPAPRLVHGCAISSCFFNSLSELGLLLTRTFVFVPVERSLRARVGLFAPLRDKLTSSAPSLVPLCAHRRLRTAQESYSP